METRSRADDEGTLRTREAFPSGESSGLPGWGNPPIGGSGSLRWTSADGFGCFFGSGCLTDV